MLRRLTFSFAILLVPVSAFAQDAQTFQNFFYEGSLQNSTYGDVGIIFGDFENANTISVGGQLGLALGQSFELGITLDFLTIDPEFGDNVSGLRDPILLGRYQVQQGTTDISVGGGLSLPIGDNEILGEGESVDIHMFGALRHMINPQLAITGVLGIDFIEQFNDEYDASLHLGGAVIYRSSPNLQLIGELNILSEVDFTLLSFGIDYSLSNSTRLRPALGLGLDDGAPDFVLVARLLFQ